MNWHLEPETHRNVNGVLKNCGGSALNAVPSMWLFSAYIYVRAIAEDKAVDFGISTTPRTRSTMFNTRLLVWTAVFFACCSRSQSSQSLTSLDVSICNKRSPLTTFSACNWLNDQLNYCAGPQVATGTAFVSCYCNQQVFNAFYEFVSHLDLALQS